jgi:hypothetical protein
LTKSNESTTKEETVFTILSLQGYIDGKPIDLTGNLETNSNTKVDRRIDSQSSSGIDFGDPLIVALMTALGLGGVGGGGLLLRRKKNGKPSS